MGSTSPIPATSTSLPDASSPSLILTRPTAEERRRTWSLTHTTWGGALSHDDYLTREAYLTTVPLAKNGGLTHWILTDSSLAENERPILSSCETLRKHAISTSPSSEGNGAVVVLVEDGIAHGIASVFTDPRFRGRGYASRMMRELGGRLRRWQVTGLSDTDTDNEEEGGKSSLFSVLYSDIGKQFYARSGWAPFESSHAAFRPVPGASSGQSGGGDVARPIGYHELAELCSVDEKLLREALVRRASATGKRCVALLPDLDAILWHLMREDFVTKHIFGRIPTIKGAVYGEPGRRIWAVWTRGYYGGLKTMEGNTLYILRVVVEGEEEKDDDEDLAKGFRSILHIAQAEAAEWRSQDVHMWNPNPRLKKIIERTGVDCEFVDRDKESIASLMWYGQGPTAELDWVANEKFCWC
ncbi:lysine acetyltransferase [Diplogelasinospora grovesii]|uniref:Lysine acetyltransferase n=1 Tax=Diplogelasinospora grovesii TaxID=303347 RepID=A0AAN6MWA7_9PEZI|nr:lysine acetyltransferase [Diplogelasinospora grovesii]